MAYDPELTDRFRAALLGKKGVTTRRMMGSVCFLVHGNMVGAAHREKDGEGIFMLRVGKENVEEALTREGARPVEMGGRTMGGFVFVDADLCDDQELSSWVELVFSFVGKLPPKAKKMVKESATQSGPDGSTGRALKSQGPKKKPMKSKTAAPFIADANRFLRALKKNNNREWFAENKVRYETALKEPGKLFAEALEDSLETLSGVTCKHKVFRIHRDIRFSKDKTPYNAYFRVAVTPLDGTGCEQAWMFGFSPTEMAVGCGAFEFSKPTLERFRKVVASSKGTEIAKILSKLAKAGAHVDPPQLKRVPTGFPKDHPRAELLRHKGVVVWRAMDVKAAGTQRPLLKECLAEYRKLLPVYQWLNTL